MTKKTNRPGRSMEVHYESVLGDISSVIDAARNSAARSVNCIMTAVYWMIGRRILEFEQKGVSGPSTARSCSKGFHVIFHRDTAGVSQKATSTRCGLSILPTRTSSRHRLENPIALDSSSGAQNFQTPSGTRELQSVQINSIHSKPFPSPLVRLCPPACRSRTNMPGGSTRPKPCAAAGRCGNSTGRSIPSSTNGRPCPETRPPC